jgi:hypothetical protein
MVLAIGEGCEVAGIGVFYVDPDGRGVLRSVSEKGPSFRLTANSSVLEGEFLAEKRSDGTWTIVGLP